MVAIISRAQWGNGLKPSGAGYFVPSSRRSEFFTHYLGTERSKQDCHAHVRAIRAFHVGPQRGWDDIGYNFLICSPHGHVFEGRGWDRTGAHSPGHNTSAFGSCIMIGQGEQPTAAALAAQRALYDEACQRVGRTLAKRGHRDGTSTDCPGDILYAWVRAGMPAGPGVPQPTPQEDDVPVKVANFALNVNKPQDYAHPGWRTVRGLLEAWGENTHPGDTHGGRTKDAVLSFQGKWKAQVGEADGIVGPRCWAHLISALNG